jgi:hypothetical protein
MTDSNYQSFFLQIDDPGIPYIFLAIGLGGFGDLAIVAVCSGARWLLSRRRYDR